MAQGKKQREALSGFDRDTQYPAAEALSLVKSLSNRKFDESVDVVARSASIPARPIRWCAAPSGCPRAPAKTSRVAVFAQGDKATAAREAGADVVGAEDLVARIEGRFPRFRRRDRLARAHAVGGQARAHARPSRPHAEPQDRHRHRRCREGGDRVQGGKVEYRTDRYGNVHVPIGKVSFDLAALQQNFSAVIDELERAKPSSSKGKYLKKVVVSSTMGPGVKVDTTTAKEIPLLDRGRIVAHN